MYLYTLKCPNMLQQKSQYLLSILHGNKRVLAEYFDVFLCVGEIEQNMIWNRILTFVCMYATTIYKYIGGFPNILF